MDKKRLVKYVFSARCCYTEKKLVKFKFSVNMTREQATQLLDIIIDFSSSCGCPDIGGGFKWPVDEQKGKGEDEQS